MGTCSLLLFLQLLLILLLFQDKKFQKIHGAGIRFFRDKFKKRDNVTKHLKPSGKIQKCKFTTTVVCVSSDTPRSRYEDQSRYAGYLGRNWRRRKGSSLGGEGSIQITLQTWSLEERGR